MKLINNKNNMKKLALALMALVSTSLFVSCSNDDTPPEVVNEEEVITTMNVTLVAGASTITLQSQDLDGDGPNAPTISVSGDLAANTTYAGTIELLNETESPAENITEEVEEEGDEHQFIFVTNGAISQTGYSDQDSGGNPIGIEFTLDTGDTGNASLQVTLRHEPTKPNDGTLAGAGGETDIAQTFNLTVQ